MRTIVLLIAVVLVVMVGCETIQQAAGKWDTPIAGEQGQTWGDMVESIAMIAVGLIPGAAVVGIPVIRSARKTLDAVFRSVAAGGGPLNPDAAKATLVKTPSAYKAFRKFKQRTAVDRAKVRNT